MASGGSQRATCNGVLLASSAGRRCQCSQFLTTVLSVVCLICASGRAWNAQPTSRLPSAEQSDTRPETTPSDRIYRVRWLPTARIELDGRADEPVWAEAVVETHFVFPWKPSLAPKTEFRAIYDETDFYFSFRVEDADIVVLERLSDEQDAVFEDRVEIYLSRDGRMNDYFCFEVDSRGRAFDYRASFYRQFDSTWSFPGLETKAASLPRGYEVEGRIPLRSFVALGFPPIRPGARILSGLYRAEFSRDRSGQPVAQGESLHNLGRKIEGPPPLEDWMSWVDPRIREPDFHVPASLGWLEFVKGS